MPRVCSYPQCAHRQSIRDKKTGPVCKMHVFPANRQVCQNWLDACHFKVSPTNIPAALYVCSCHFAGGRGPTNNNPNPISYVPLNEAEAANLQKRFQPNARALVETMEISIDPFEAFLDESNPDDPAPMESNFNDVLSIQNNLLEFTQSPVFIPPSVPVKSCESAQLSSGNNICLSSSQQDSSKATSSIGVELEVENNRRIFLAIPLRLTHPGVEAPPNKDDPFSLKEKNEGLTTRDVGVQCDFAAFSYEHFVRTCSDMDFEHMTGVSKISFDVLYEFLGGDEVCSQLNYRYDDNTPVKEIDMSHSRKGHLFMTLVRLRRGFALRDMSLMFSLKRCQISAIFFTWVKFLASKFRSLEKFMFLTVADQQKDKPDCYKQFPNLRCVIASTDIEIQKPADRGRQDTTDCLNDNCDSVKFLIATSVLGGLSFISAGIEGNVSDRKLFMKSGILQYLFPGEVIMADRSYGVESHLEDLDIQLITPPALGKTKSFSSEESKAVATSQTHLQRFLTEMKKFKFIRHVVPYTVLDLLPDIVRICACLFNFRDPFIKWHVSDNSNNL